MSFLWVIEKSLQKTLVTNQLELKECGVSGAIPLPVGLLLEPNPAALRERGLACSLSLPSSWPSVLALQASSPASSLLCSGLLSAFGGVPDL